jgi:signal transduction histidine kinase
MSPNLKFSVRPSSRFDCLSPYQEIAIYVRELLQCDYALVAVPEHDSFRIQAIAGAERQYAGLVADIIQRLRDWGPVVVDESRLIAVPVSSEDRMLGVLIGYSASAGAFTATDLEKLTAYSNAAAAILANHVREGKPEPKAPFDRAELSRFSRLITMGELSSCFANDVANPLTLIREHTRLLRDNLRHNDPLLLSVDIIDRAARRLEDMTKQMADFMSSTPAEPHSCDVGDVISEALKFVQPFLRTPSIQARTAIANNLPLVRADRRQLVQAIVNLLRNAIDAMGSSQRRVLSIAARLHENQIRISVSDTGTGISARHIPNIFDPFFSTKGEGVSGLGLYVTKQVVQQYHGTMGLETGKGGTTFVLNLPLPST